MPRHIVFWKIFCWSPANLYHHEGTVLVGTGVRPMVDVKVGTDSLVNHVTVPTASLDVLLTSWSAFEFSLTSTCELPTSAFTKWDDRSCLKPPQTCHLCHQQRCRVRHQLLCDQCCEPLRQIKLFYSSQPKNVYNAMYSEVVTYKSTYINAQCRLTSVIWRDLVFGPS